MGGVSETLPPEPFLSALRGARPGDVADLEAPSPAALYGRALARLELGRDREARIDLEAALPALGDAASIEIAYLDLREKTSLEGALRRAEGVLSRAPAGGALAARALHVMGLARAKLRRTAEAIETLLGAADAYAALGDQAGRARVQDTLGMLYASGGRLDLALSAYAISLVEKTLAGDRYGMAITLGNLGRAHLKAGRCRDALRCFELDLRLAGELGDQRGCARMLNDIGRARMALEDFEEAEVELRRSLELAQRSGYGDIELFARKDLALTLIAVGRLDDAEQQIDGAESLLAAHPDPFLATLLLAARGELLLARKDPQALAILEQAAKRFADADLPDQEIPLRLTLARAYAEQKLKRMAEVCLESALERARRDGFERYLRQIRERMAELGSAGTLVEEAGRLPGPEQREALPDGYILLERLGRGAYGEVFRAYDPLRDQLVALKRIRAGRLYDSVKRDELLRSARLELEAASQIRHPGLARVFAIGHDQEGNGYVVQELVRGRPLRELMGRRPFLDAALVLAKARLIAASLRALHGRGIVHRDLKPENIILRAPDDSPALVDFGIAHVAGYEEGFGAVGLKGTFPYIAPELFQNRPAGPGADMYSLGVLLHEWLAGKLPWDLETLGWSDAVRRKLETRPEPLPGALPAGLLELVESLMAPEPERRPEAAEVEAWCERLLEEAPAVEGWTTSAAAEEETLGLPPEG
jgi:tetratricopeptide (TPR) repeat protein